MTTVPANALTQQLKWRYATKKFDATKRIDPITWAALEEALVLSPSSYGLQPWKFVVVTDPALKAKLRPVSWNQAQVEDCSHHVVFLVKKDLGLPEIERFVDRIAEVRGVTRESLEMYRGFMVGDLAEGPRSKVINEWAARQVYIALGNFMTAAAMLGVDTCPMEGLDPAKYDEILGLEGSGWATLCACPAGYRAADDKYATLAKVRFKAEDLIEHR
jgi:nitroreductase